MKDFFDDIDDSVKLFVAYQEAVDAWKAMVSIDTNIFTYTQNILTLLNKGVSHSLILSLSNIIGHDSSEFELSRQIDSEPVVFSFQITTAVKSIDEFRCTTT